MQVGLLNVDGYYNSLLSFIDKAVDEGFIDLAARHIIVSAETPRELMCKLEVHFCNCQKIKDSFLFNIYEHSMLSRI